ncbi:MAG: hypothetical protein LBM12_03080 [Candidatus Nomurabacteria bacterium]|jgi:uncharacterized repeat protein (TIGR01451 family)|nr:hypothetical protein [Candidatus Nomurabacteria bacterium]
MKKVLGIAGTAIAAATLFSAPVFAEAQSITLTAGAHNGKDAFVKRVDAKVGDEVLMQMSFKNNSGEKFNPIAARVVLPTQLSFVSGSTTVYNRTNPNGLANADGIATEFIDLGGYSPVDNEGRGQGSVSYKVKVNGTGLVCGVNTLNVVNEVAGYQNGKIATDTFVAYSAVDVVKTCASEKPELPTTGPVAVAATALGAGALATAAGYIVSRKK